LDHFVGADEQRLGHFDAERLGGLRFATNSNWVGCSTGRSPGFAPQGPFPIRRECVAQYWPPVPPRGHCERRMEVFVSLRGFSTDQ